MDISLYFHVPFCSKKCPYCHFYSVLDRPQFQEIYANSLKLEWQNKLPLLQGNKIVSIYFGGGTPTLFAPHGIAAILELVHQSNLIVDSDCEITIEANPEKLNSVLLNQLKSLGINRLSIGVQSLDDHLLKELNRSHSAQKALQAIDDASSIGFTNISIDLMYDLPNQTSQSWQMTLDSLKGLPITHCSLYNLTIEPHTPFFRKKETLQKILPTPEQSLQLLQMATHQLEKIGFRRYEISAFAKNQMISRHNSGYWTGRPFLGFGPSAFSYWEGSRFKNTSNLHQYASSLLQKKSAIEFSEKLSYPANVNELLAIHLRLLDGVKEDELMIPFDTLPILKKLKNEGLLSYQNHCWKLTDFGVLFYDTIAEQIISEESITQLQ